MFSFKKFIVFKNLSSRLYSLKIPSDSIVLVGGHHLNGVPNYLLGLLSKTNSTNLTLVTNISILQPELRDLIEQKRKLKQIITSLDSNRINKFIDKSIEIKFLDSFSLIEKFCNLNIKNKNLAEFALVKGDFLDQEGNVCWRNDFPTYYNDIFAKSAVKFSIAQVDCEIGQIENISKVESGYFNGVFIENKISDRDLEVIAKRVLLEFENNQNIYLMEPLRNLIENFYLPKHINVKINNSMENLDLCVVQIKKLNSNGQIELYENDNLSKKALNNLQDYTRIIGLLTNIKQDDKIPGQFDKTVDYKCIPDLIISDDGVLKFNKHHRKYQLIELNSFQGTKSQSVLSTWTYKPFVERDSLKPIFQQCF